MEGDATIAGGHIICYSPEAKSKDTGVKICIQVLVWAVQHWWYSGKHSGLLTLLSSTSCVVLGKVNFLCLNLLMFNMGDKE